MARSRLFGIGPVQSQKNLARLWPRIGFSLLIALVFVALLMHRLQPVDLAAVAAGLATVPVAHWALAGLGTAISFWAVGQYDITLHRHLGTGAGPARAGRAGVAAIAVAQTVGLGVISGALIRWRMLPEQTLWQATRVSLAVSLSFLAGWLVVTAAVVLLLPGAAFKPLAMLGLIAASAAAGLCLLRGEVMLLGHRIALPNGITLARIVGLAAVDTIAAAWVLHLLLPIDAGLAFGMLLPAFLVAFGAGLVSGAPGGIGAFEVTLLALLPAVAEAPLLTAILAYRVIYYATPACLGALIAAIGPLEKAKIVPDICAHGRLRSTGCAEAGLLRQGVLQPLRIGAGLTMAGRTRHGLIALRDPVGVAAEIALRALRQTAQAENRLPAFYKCGPRFAARARRDGWQVVPVAQELWLEPDRFTLASPMRAGLRRKLRRSEAAGVTVRLQLSPQDEAGAIAGLAVAWAEAHGGERGFSMGRFCPEYLAGQRVYLAFAGGRLVGFVSFHNGAREWSLDLMRHCADAPDGVMQMLITQALTDAARLRVPRLSLAAVPDLGWLGARLARLLGEGSSGLVQFKRSFAPRAERLYLAAPGKMVLAICAAEIARAIHRPAPLVTGGNRPWRIIHNHDEDYEFE